MTTTHTHLLRCVAAGALLMVGVAIVAVPADAQPRSQQPAPGVPVAPAGASVVAADSPACEPEFIADELYVRCVLADAATSIDIAQIPAASGSDELWIQAWGGAGGTTPVQSDTVGTGGAAGFAQTVTTVDAYESRFGTTTLYYLLGGAGVFSGAANAGYAGTGGASTLVSSVPPTNNLDTATDVVVVAGGGGGGGQLCPSTNGSPVGPSSCEGAAGGDGGVAMSNASGQQRPAEPGVNGGAPGNGGIGGSSEDGQTQGADGVGGAGGGSVGVGGGSDALPPTGWVNDPSAVQTLTAGRGDAQEDGCNSVFWSPPACMFGGGGGGWGGGAAGFDELDFSASGGGGGGSFAVPSTTSDPQAPTLAPAGPVDGIGEVHLVFRVPIDFRSTFCTEQRLAGQEGFLCELPFNWAFQIPDGFLGEDWFVTMTANGGRGGNGAPAGQAQTTRTTNELAGETLYAWVGAAGAVSTTHGGSGGGASALALTDDPFSATISDDLLLVAGGSGGGMGLGVCGAESGSGGVAVAVDSSPVGASGVNGKPPGTDLPSGGGGAIVFGESYVAGIGGLAPGDPGADGRSALTFAGGPGGDGGPIAATLATGVLGEPIGPPPLGGGNAGGGSGYCHGGGGGAGAGSGGGGAGGSIGSDGLITSYVSGGTGGGGGSVAAGTDVDPTNLPGFAKVPITPRDETQGSVSLFFFQQGGSGPPPVPPDNSTINDVQPTLGYNGTSTAPLVYRISEAGQATPLVVSRPTALELWTVPIDGALQPGTTYEWDIVDGAGNALQSPRSFTVGENVADDGNDGVRVEMRSMNWFATQPNANAPAFVVPEPGQAVPQAQTGTIEGCPENAPSDCQAYRAALDDPDDYGTYFTTETAVQATTFQPSINFDWATHDPFGVGISELFTLRVTGAITVPVSGTYTFAVNSAGGARFTLNNPSGAPLGGGPLVDTWGQLNGACFASFPAVGEEDFTQLAIFLATFTCTNTNGVAAGRPVALEAGVTYPFVMDGFMSWAPGPFQLLYSQEFFAETPAPVPGAWLTQDCTTCEGATAPPPTAGAPWVTFSPERFGDSRAGFDTLDGGAAGGGENPAGGVFEVPIAGRGSVPVDAAGVLANVTVTGAEGPGFATLFDCGNRPNASTLNFQPDRSVANGAVMGLSPSGSVCVYTNRAAHVIVDVGGYVPSDSPVVTSGSERVLDTRPGFDTLDGLFAGGGTNGAGETVEVAVAGRGSVPADAAAVFANVTVTGADAAGFATVTSCGDQPATSSLNHQAQRSVANNALVELSPAGLLCVYSQRDAHVVVDITGYVPAGVDALSLFEAERFADTRDGFATIDGDQVGGGPIAGGQTLEVPIAGRGSVPADAVTAVANVTVTDAESAGFATAYQCGEPPSASTLNFQPGESTANTTITAFSTDGSLCVFVNQAADVVVDVTAYTTAPDNASQ
ncbi:MAG: PA14 domain-containing protein [Actinomycetota bacterium]